MEKRILKGRDLVFREYFAASYVSNYSSNVYIFFQTTIARSGALRSVVVH